MRRRSNKHGKTKKTASRGSAKPVVFRLAGLASRSPAPGAGRSTPNRRNDDADPMAALASSVSPLEGAERVARLAERARSPRAAIESDERKVLSFVVEREGACVDAYRMDLRARPKVPGRDDWSPEAQIDLHGVRARDVHARLALTLRECLRHRRARLLVIHGKGLHSARGESVLGAAVVESLISPRHARLVRAFATAPEHLGGSGALAVELDVSAIGRFEPSR